MEEHTSYMTVGELAEYLRFSKGNIYMKIKRGVFPSEVVKKIDKSYRFDIESLKRWLESKDVGHNGSKADKNGGSEHK